MNNVIMRKTVVTADYQPLAAEKTVASVTISTPPGNAADVTFKAEGGNEVDWVPGEWHEFRSISLADIEVKGAAGDIVTIVGGTW